MPGLGISRELSAQTVGTYVIGTVCSQAVCTYVVSAVSGLAIWTDTVGSVGSQAVCTYMVSAISGLAVRANTVGAVGSQAVRTDMISAISGLAVWTNTVGTVCSQAYRADVGMAGAAFGDDGRVGQISAGGHGWKCESARSQNGESETEDQFIGFHEGVSNSVRVSCHPGMEAMLRAGGLLRSLSDC
jgi:hypothetical protein